MKINLCSTTHWLIAVLLGITSSSFAAEHLDKTRNLQPYGQNENVQYNNVVFEADGLCEDEYDRCFLESALKQCFNDALKCVPTSTITYGGGYTRIIEYTDVIISDIIINDDEERRRYLRKEFSSDESAELRNEIRQSDRKIQNLEKCTIEISVQILVEEEKPQMVTNGNDGKPGLPQKEEPSDPISHIFLNEGEEETGVRLRHLKMTEYNDKRIRRRTTGNKSRYTGSEETINQQRKGTKGSSETNEKKKLSKSSKSSSAASSSYTSDTNILYIGNEQPPYKPIAPLPDNGNFINGDKQPPQPPLAFEPQIDPEKCGEPLFIDLLRAKGFEVNAIKLAKTESVTVCDTPLACKYSICGGKHFPGYCANEGHVCDKDSFP